ncbi:EVE domain-containing protein [Desulfovibrio psychrotolerans]|uniref:EVE domain-containing protein n=1 Tax=Desulfovibrio psychrotolerans TaxID=415242 RepID=A0A7J0BU06_9BACT|nr:EVE domain-containing protein [Desulfovibrio psychrotolerans]GFM37199.1 EVE domain-containing protein [Desulfovibrio psychrotolerans]
MPRYWLMKSEPGCFSIDDLKNAPGGISPWDGVRNYQARNFMRDDMRAGDKVLFYHSVTNPGVAGVAEVVRESYPDHTAWDPENNHFDPASTPESPRWFMVDVRFAHAFARPVTLREIRNTPGLEDMELLRKGSRLSVMPVTQEQFEIICALGG